MEFACPFNYRVKNNFYTFSVTELHFYENRQRIQQLFVYKFFRTDIIKYHARYSNEQTC